MAITRNDVPQKEGNLLPKELWTHVQTATVELAKIRDAIPGGSPESKAQVAAMRALEKAGMENSDAYRQLEQEVGPATMADAIQYQLQLAIAATKRVGQPIKRGRYSELFGADDEDDDEEEEDGEE